MVTQTIKVTELRNRTREIMQRVRFKSEKFLIENFGQPMAVILSVEEYETLVSAALGERLSADTLQRAERLVS